MPSSISLIIPTNNLITHTAFAISLTLIFSLLKIPALFLHGLHTYIHPDDVSPNGNSSSSGIRAAIRRPGETNAEQPKPRKKSKDKFEFDENKAQIFRLKLSEGHLQSRIYFKEFYSAFNFTLIAFLSLLLHRFLRVDVDSGLVKNGTIIPLLLGFVGVCRLFVSIIRVGFEKSASKKLDRELSFLCGVLGFFVGLIVVFEIIPKWVLDFGFKSLDGLVKFFLAVLMGCIVGYLYIPALRNARAFWLGTDQIRCNLSIISCGWFSRTLLYANYVIALFTSLLWISPFADFLLDKNLDGESGMSKSSFDNLRRYCLLITGFLQFLSVRSNVQMFLNEAVLCWYQRLHASKFPELEFSRAKVFLHNHFLCLVVVQFFVPSMTVLILFGLSQLDDRFLKGILSDENVLNYSALAKEIALFMAWWIVFVWAVLSSAVLALYRHGTLYVS
ncbi:transmembrane protein 161b [Phtheirospermum japonicum]|uniref:Transmembrane protein 161b n=1 Tax=Phtheirospermum japonicum TaxID=374723 RepID=A0A830BHB8_9LAMI|nr:transmembrane protein 161b [Phtheirospermum japonicum]